MKKTSIRTAHRWISTLLVTAWLLAACSPGAWQNVQPSPTAESGLAMHPCRLAGNGSSALTDAQCGVLAVPEDRAAPGGRQIRLAVARIPAVSREPQADPLFLIAGGPGQAATQTFLQLISAFERVRQDRDLVLVDQRGTGSSGALTCPAEDIHQGLDLADPLPEVQANLARTCLEGLHADPRHYTTQDFVQDLDAVRAALGYSKINLLGVSYGTRVAQEYLRAYPRQVRSLVLDGVAPVDWPIGQDAAQDAQAGMEAIFKRCAQEDACQAAFPNFRSEFAQLFAELDRQPQQVRLADPVSGENIQLLLTHARAASTLYSLSYSAQTAALIPLLVHTAVAGGDASRLAAQYLILRGQSQASIADGLYLSVVCAEDAPFYSNAAAPIRSYLPDGRQTILAECANWPHAVQAAEQRQAVRSDAPALLLSGEADPVTPAENAARVGQGLPNSVQLVAPGMGHNVVFQGCLPRVVADFIQAGTAKGLDTTCISSMKPDPFFVNFSGPKP